MFVCPQGVKRKWSFPTSQSCGKKVSISIPSLWCTVAFKLIHRFKPKPHIVTTTVKQFRAVGRWKILVSHRSFSFQILNC